LRKLPQQGAEFYRLGIKKPRKKFTGMSEPLVWLLAERNLAAEPDRGKMLTIPILLFECRAFGG